MYTWFSCFFGGNVIAPPFAGSRYPPPQSTTAWLKMTTSASSHGPSVTSWKHTPARNRFPRPSANAESHDPAPWSKHTLNEFLYPRSSTGWCHQSSA